MNGFQTVFLYVWYFFTNYFFLNIGQYKVKDQIRYEFVLFVDGWLAENQILNPFLFL